MKFAVTITETVVYTTEVEAENEDCARLDAEEELLQGELSDCGNVEGRRYAVRELK